MSFKIWINEYVWDVVKIWNWFVHLSQAFSTSGLSVEITCVHICSSMHTKWTAYGRSNRAMLPFHCEPASERASPSTFMQNVNLLGIQQVHTCFIMLSRSACVLFINAQFIRNVFFIELPRHDCFSNLPKNGRSNCEPSFDLHKVPA